MEIFNPLDKFYKSQTGAVREGDMITFRVKGEFNSVVFLLNKDGVDEFEYYQLIKKDGYFECSLSFLRGLYFYYFQINDSDQFISLSNEYNGKISNEINKFQLTVFDKEYSVPNWIQGGIIYQIFPDRFAIGNEIKKIEDGKILHKDLNDIPNFEPNEKGEVLNNDFFGGDLRGIINKLEYLSDLGVSVIYLNPIFNAYSNHRYDTGDYMQIDPLLGNREDLIDLIKKANDKNIKIVLDGVFNHTGADSIYFNKYNNYNSVGAYQSKDSNYYSWYNFKNFPNEYEAWWGIKTLPAVNEKDQGFIDFITGENGVLDFYTRLGIAGWRLDVVDELPDFFVKKIRSVVKKANSEAIIIGEVWEDASNKIAYGVRREYFQGYELDSVMNYPLKNAIIEFVINKRCKNLLYTIKEQIDHYPVAVLNSLMNILSTHDTYRLLSAVSGENVEGKTKKEMAEIKIADYNFENAIFKLKVATLLQFTLPGVPSIYYGDEVGMEGYVDPLNRKFFPWGKENVQILDWYKFLGNLRKSYSVFKNGEFSEIYTKNGVFIYKRSSLEQEILVAINLSDKNYKLSYNGELFDLIFECDFVDEYQLQAQTIALLVNKVK